MLTSFLDNLSSALLPLKRNGIPLVHSKLDWMIMTNGEAEPDDNIILFGFDEKSSQPALVAKVPRSLKNEWMLRNEYARLNDAWNCLETQAAFRLPEPLAMLYIDAQPVLVISYLGGKSLLRSSLKGFWKDTKQVSELFLDAARSLREVDEFASAPIAEGEVIPSNVLPKIEKFGQLNVLSIHEKHALSEMMDHMNIQGLSATRKVLMQGDFWHGNIIRGSEHGKLMFLDWQYSRWFNDISLDVYMFLLAAALATVPRRSDEERAKDAIKTLLNWRSEIIPLYLSAYGKPEGYSLLPARQGMLLCCVEKNVRSVIDFGHNQNGDSVWRVLFSELVNLPEKGGFYDGI